MKKFLALTFFLCSIQPLYAEQVFKIANDQYILPDSSIPSHEDAGRAMHTNLIFHAYNSLGVPDDCETPASMACIYGLTTQVAGCPIHGTTALPDGGWGAIALVDAYDNPNAESDLNTFSAAFGLPACTTANGCFSVVYASGTRPPYNPSSADEHVLDIEWSHAMAPNAKIILVEAESHSSSDMDAAEDVASALVVANGGGMVSNSWGVEEDATETNRDSHFQTPGVVYFASSGDYSAPARYPGSSPFVISAGGTSILRDAQGNFIGEAAWSTNPDVPIGSKSGSSGGPSLYEPRPAFQDTIMKLVGTRRGSPDISFNADPATGVCVYSTAHGGWLRDGGTSVSSPALAGIINSANHRVTTTQEELTYIYNNALKNYHAYWHDILSGNNGFPTLPGYDFVTGLGSPFGYAGK
jgi:subtilase family serine protease